MLTLMAAQGSEGQEILTSCLGNLMSWTEDFIRSWITRFKTGVWHQFSGAHCLYLLGRSDRPVISDTKCDTLNPCNSHVVWDLLNMN